MNNNTTYSKKLKIPSNPLLQAALRAIWVGGKNFEQYPGWSIAERDVFVYEYRAKHGYLVITLPDQKSVTLLSPLTANVLIAILILIAVQPGNSPVLTSLNEIAEIMQFKRYGAEKSVFCNKTLQEIELIQKMKIYGTWQVRDPETKRWLSKGVELNDVIFSIEKDGNNFVLLPGKWEYWWFNKNCTYWYAELPHEIFSLSRYGRSMLRKLSLYLHLIKSQRINRKKGTIEISINIQRVLESIGEIPKKEFRCRNWGNRTYTRLHNAVSELKEKGFLLDVKLPSPCSRNRSWVKKWLLDTAYFTFQSSQNIEI